MRILVATDQWFPDRLGGVARVVTETSKRWAAAGHEVVVLAPAEGESNGHTDGLQVLRALPRGPVPQTLADPVMTRRMSRRLGARFDVLVAHSCTTAWGLLAARSHAPLLSVFHADVAEEARYLRSTAPTFTERLSARLFEHPLRRLERTTLRRAAAVVVLSEFSRDLLRVLASDVADSALSAPGAVDTRQFSPEDRDEARARLGLEPATRLVLSVRRLVPRMGLEHLVDAAASLRDVEGLHVAIAGGGSLSDALAARADAHGLGARLRLLGRLTDDELRAWYRAADLFVLPTLAHEGFGLATVEALASGTPVVGTPVGATPELLTPLEPRLVTTGTDAKALAVGIRTGLDLATPEFRARCRAYVEKRFSWDAAMPAWERALEAAVAAGSAV